MEARQFYVTKIVYHKQQTWYWYWTFTYNISVRWYIVGDGKDRMSVVLVDGSLQVRVRLASGSFNAEFRPPRNNVRYDDGQWHRLVVSREAREVGFSCYYTV